MPRHPQTATTAQTLSDRVFSQLAQRASTMADVYSLHVGDTYREPLDAARAEKQLTADHPRLHNYAPVQGEPTLLHEIGKHIERRSGHSIDPSRVQVTSGATSGLSIVCESILDVGDEVLLPSPYWPLIRGIIASRGATPVQVPFWDRLGSAADVEARLDAAVTDRTVALYINTPSNPTGQIVPDDVLAAMARIAERHDLWVLCDEAYESIYFGESPPSPVWARTDFANRAIACHTLSKGYGLAGARVGFTHGPSEAMSIIRGVQTFQTYCAPRPMQLGAARALAEGEAWLAESRRLYGEAGRRAAEALGIAPPEGGTFLFFDATRHLAPGEDIAGFLGRCLDAGVLLTPGSACGADYSSWVRLCFTSLPPHELELALERLKPLLDS